MPIGAQRLLAFIAMHESPLLRSSVAEALWPGSPRRRAGANLRCAVWRTRQTGHNLLETQSNRLALTDAVTVDLRERTITARRLLDAACTSRPTELEPGLIGGLSQELLSDWYEDWLLIQRDCWDQLRLHALESLAERLLAAGSLAQAGQAALAAVAAEPLRESAHRVLIRVYAAEGNWSDAVAQYRRYRTLLQRELHLPPTSQMEDLIRALVPRQPAEPAPVIGSSAPAPQDGQRRPHAVGSER